MATNTNPELLINIAQDFYLNHLTIADISSKYAISRYKISKYLDEAYAEKIVSITIRSPFNRNLELENQLSQTYPGHHFYVLASPEADANDSHRFYEFAAQQVQKLIEPLKIVGLSWGDTVYNVIDQFKPITKEHLTFTQFVGENGKYNSLAGSMRMVQKAANKYNSRYLTINAPLYLLNDQTRQALRQEPAIAPTLQAAQQIDLILTGLGTLESVESIDSWHQSFAALFPDVQPQAIAGLLYGRPFDRTGHFLNTVSTDKTFGLSIEAVSKVATRVAVVNNKFKSTALAAALTGQFLTDLILDEPTAAKVLALKKA